MNKTSWRVLRAQERRALAFELRKAGNNYRDIAATIIWEFGAENLPKSYDCRQVWMDVNHELKQLREQLASDVAAVRQMELERLDAMQAAIWDDALDGNLGAIEKMLKLMKRRADVVGIDAAAQHIIHNVDLDKLSYEQLERLAAGESVFDVMFNNGEKDGS